MDVAIECKKSEEKLSEDEGEEVDDEAIYFVVGISGEEVRVFGLNDKEQPSDELVAYACLQVVQGYFLENILDNGQEEQG